MSSAAEVVPIRAVVVSSHSYECVWIYLSFPGSIVPMRVLESESIEAVKLRIQGCQGFLVKTQKLICGGRELARSESLVRDYGVSHGNVLHLVFRLSGLQTINVRTSCREEFTFQVERSSDIGYVKRQIANENGLKDVDEEEDQEVLHNGEILEDQKLINDLSENNESVTHLFVKIFAKIRTRPLDKNLEFSILVPKLNDTKEYDSSPEDENLLLEPVIVNPKIELPKAVKKLINSTLEGLRGGSDRVSSSEGTGGAYFMQDASQSKYIAVFKPIDEEPLGVNNPHGLAVSVNGEGLKRGTRVGEGALRECAAYILDHPKKRSDRLSFSGEEVKGFSGVPPTFLVKCLHRGFNHPEGVKTKIGSLQLFVENDGSCEDWRPGAFPVDEVHKIAVLDMRIANADRHSGNILVSKGKDGGLVLIPIDHGYCLPESFEDCTFDWLDWPQARQPFSRETIEYISSLDAEEDIGLLKFSGWELPPESALVFRISTMLLKKGAERGLTPFAIGNVMCRERLNEESVIKIVKEALDSVPPDSSEAEFLECVSFLMDVYLDKIA